MMMNIKNSEINIECSYKTLLESTEHNESVRIPDTDSIKNILHVPVLERGALGIYKYLAHDICN